MSWYCTKCNISPTPLVHWCRGQHSRSRYPTGISKVELDFLFLSALKSELQYPWITVFLLLLELYIEAVSCVFCRYHRTRLADWKCAFISFNENCIHNRTNVAWYSSYSKLSSVVLSMSVTRCSPTANSLNLGFESWIPKGSRIKCTYLSQSIVITLSLFHANMYTQEVD